MKNVFCCVAIPSSRYLKKQEKVKWQKFVFQLKETEITFETVQVEMAKLKGSLVNAQEEKATLETKLKELERLEHFFVWYPSETMGINTVKMVLLSI